jgi:REG-2-like HAD superfamily hydrolase
VSGVTKPEGLKAVSLDAAGTLLFPREPIAVTYTAFARRHGSTVDETFVEREFPKAMVELRPLRVGDPHWRAYFAAVIERCTKCTAPELVNELYDHYAKGDAWLLADGVRECITALREAGLKIAVLSNWDVRLRMILDDLGVTPLVDALLVSAEIGVDKPDRRAFTAVCTGFGVKANELLHLGDDAEVDVEGARAAGCHGWLFGTDVRDFAELRAKLV